MTPEFWAALASLGGVLIWLVKLTYEYHQFKKNHIHDMEVKIALLQSQVTDIKADIHEIKKRIDKIEDKI